MISVSHCNDYCIYWTHTTQLVLQHFLLLMRSIIDIKSYITNHNIELWYINIRHKINAGCKDTYAILCGFDWKGKWLEFCESRNVMMWCWRYDIMKPGVCRQHYVMDNRLINENVHSVRTIWFGLEMNQIKRRWS